MDAGFLKNVLLIFKHSDDEDYLKTDAGQIFVGIDKEENKEKRDILNEIVGQLFYVFIKIKSRRYESRVVPQMCTTLQFRCFCPLIPLPRCRRQRALCFWKLDNLTIFSLLKLKRTFVYTVINHFFNKWWCTFVALPNQVTTQLPEEVAERFVSGYDYIKSQGKIEGKEIESLIKSINFSLTLMTQLPEWSIEKIAELASVEIDFLKKLQKGFQGGSAKKAKKTAYFDKFDKLADFETKEIEAILTKFVPLFK